MNNKLIALQNIMVAQTHKNDMVANNLANVNTNGYKRDIMFMDVLRENTKPMATIHVQTDFSKGPLKPTGNPLDFALSGSGFFVVNTDQGEALTRDGHFTVADDGTLLTGTRHPVSGTAGPINVSLDGQVPGDIAVSTDGEIYIGDQLIGQFRIVDVEDYSALEKRGDNLFALNPETRMMDVYDTQVLQGQLEGSNVNPVNEMVHLIELQRQFESSQRAMHTVDQILGKAANNISRYR